MQKRREGLVFLEQKAKKEMIIKEMKLPWALHYAKKLQLYAIDEQFPNEGKSVL